MPTQPVTADDLDDIIPPEQVPEARRKLGRTLFMAGSAVLVVAFLVQALHSAGLTGWGFSNWRPVVYAYLLWAICYGASQVLTRGDDGVKALFVLPAVLFIAAMVVFPLLFGLWIAFSDWNLSSLTGRKFNGLANVYEMWRDPFYWNALLNMVWYVLAVLVEYAIAFGLALLLHSEIRARKFFRVVFLLPLMLSPVAVSWMVGKSMMEVRFGPLANLARWLGWDSPSFFSDPWLAKLAIMAMDAWTFIPLMMIMLLAGLRRHHHHGDLRRAGRCHGFGDELHLP
jgi:multiple sugar transport system permease protein